MDSALPIFLFAVAALAVPLGMIVAGWLLGPSRPGRVKAMPYESGMDPIHDTRRRFDVRFYLVAIAFLVFDVELLFLYPWATVAYSDASDASWKAAFGRVVFWEVIVFILSLGVGYVYAWRKGVFRWR